MNKNILLTIFIGIFLISVLPFMSAKLQDVKQGQCIDIQVISNCSTVDLTQISNKNETFVINSPMTNLGGQTYNYTFCNTNQLGEYRYTWNPTCIDCSSSGDCGNLFEVTSSGQSGSGANIAFFIIVILLIYGITFIGFFGKSIPMTILGGGAMLFLGVYLFNNGIIIFRDDITKYISYVTIGIGAIFAIWASYEWFSEM